MNSAVDVAIVGAGPAGLAAASILGRNGLNVAVFDRRTLPIDKVCGEGVMPPGVALLRELGAAEFLQNDEFRPFAGIRYLSADGASAEAEFAEGPGWGVRRTNLSQALARCAGNFANVEICDETPVDGIEPNESGVELRTARGNLQARLLIGADGLHSRVRRWAGLEGRPARHKRLGIRRHFQVSPWSRFVEVHAGRGVEAYVTPCGPNQVGVACLWERQACPGAKPGPDLFDSLISGAPLLREKLDGAVATTDPLTTGPLEQKTRRRIADSVILLGDAAGYLDACTGEGITLALNQAHALETQVVPELLASTAPIAARNLRGFANACRQLTRSYYVGTRFLLFLNRRPRLMHRFIRQLNRRPELLRHLLSFNMGAGTLLPDRAAVRRILTAHAES